MTDSIKKGRKKTKRGRSLFERRESEKKRNRSIEFEKGERTTLIKKGPGREAT